YDPQRARDNGARLPRALGDQQPGEFRLQYARKANRFRPLLTELRRSPLFGIDASSPEELREALACGFAPERISYTA
ncbi:diaminopimelate decarboxylase, partial [Burkholderia pseudomallei]